MDDLSGVYGNRTFLGFRGQQRLAIGQHWGLSPVNTFYRGDLAEVLFYNRVLSAAERNSVGTYLQEKYSLRTSYGPAPRFERDIRPILARRCHACHGPGVREAGLDLRSVTAMADR